MNDNHLQIAILCKPINYDIIDYYIQNFSNQSILVVSPEKIKPAYLSRVEYKNDAEFLDRNEIEEKFKKIEHKGLRDKQLIPSWYYQQILKYKIVIGSKFKYTHIIDGDSIITNSLIRENTVFTAGNHTQSFYRNFNKILLGSDLDSVTKMSLITNQMVFDKSILNKLLHIVEDRMKTNWVDAIITVLLNNKELMFSEYQLYGEFATANCPVKIETTKVFRRMDLVNSSQAKALKKYSIISFEPHHKTTILRKIRARLFFLLGRSLG